MQYKKVFAGNFPRGNIKHNNGKFNPYFVTDVEVSTTDPLKAPETYILCYDADTSATSDLSEFGHDLQTSVQGPQYRVGYMIEGTHTTIQWGSWTAFDGSFDPSTLYLLMLGYNTPYPMWFNKITAWKKQVTDAEILEA